MKTIGVTVKIATFVLLILGCTKNQQEVTPPERLKNIPKTAIWHGGSDGGNWYDCVQTSNMNYKCDIYKDWGDGKLEKTGHYQLAYYIWNNKLQKAEYYTLDQAHKHIEGAWEGENSNIKTLGILVLKEKN